MTVALVFTLACLLQDSSATLTHGPLRGGSDSRSMDFWARASAPGEYTLQLKTDPTSSSQFPAPKTSAASAENDLTLHWRVGDLQPATKYVGMAVFRGDQEIWSDPKLSVRTPAGDDAIESSVVFGSCSNERAYPEQPIWGAISAGGPDALVLLGDTPYIDSTDLEVQRRRYREFFAFEPVRRALSETASYFTWDDHDYAADGQWGRVKGRENVRRAFLEYHASGDLGLADEGIFQSFRRGPIEVFLLDTRWFGDTENSPLAEGERSLLGDLQITWLQRGLQKSKADFKLLACGMVWNSAVRPNKRDCWCHWMAERDGLLRWIGERKISGVVLIGGDIHRSRVILHPVKSLAGYDVPEFISSPLAQSVIESAKVDAPGLLFDVGTTSAFLRVDATRGAEGALLRARILDSAGKELFSKTMGLAELSPPKEK